MRETKSSKLWMTGVAALAAIVVSLSQPVRGAPQADAEPAAAFPAETLFYVEIRKPAEHFDVLASLEIWDEVSTTMAALAEALDQKAPQRAAILQALSGWREDLETARQVELLAGERLIVAMTSAPSEFGLEVVVAAESDNAERQAEALHALSRRDFDLSYWGWPVHRATSPRRSGGADSTRAPESSWLVLGPSPEAESVASVLSGRVTRRVSLPENEAFDRLMSELPAEASVRAFVNTPALLDLLEQDGAADRRVLPVIRAVLRPIEGVAVARHVASESIAVWFASRITPAGREDSWGSLIGRLSPLEQSLRLGRPENALAVLEVGVNIGEYLGAFADIVAESAPRTYSALKQMTEDFRTYTGLDPSSDLFSSLADQFMVVVLPREEAGDWPLPRSVVVVGAKDPIRARDFLKQFMAWEAGAVAAFSEGILSAMVVEDVFQGVSITGLQVDGVISHPLPSPSYAMVGDVLLASPVRSAVREMIPFVHHPAPTGDLSTLDGDEGSAVEAVFLDLSGWAGEVSRLAEGLAKHGKTIDEHFLKVLKTLTHLLEALGRAEGVTVLREDGVFVFHLEIRL